METTYDPILDGPEQLPYMQWRSLAPPRLGTALVLTSSRGELVECPAGAPVPAVRFGNYRSAYYIDTAEHQLVLDANLPSSAPGFVFQAHVTYRCRVIDPRQVAIRQIHDVGGLLGPRLIALMRAATRHKDISEAAAAEEAVEDALKASRIDPAMAISLASVEFPVQAEEASTSGWTFRETSRTSRLTEMKVGPMRELLAGGSPDLLALHLANHPEDTGPVMEMIVAGDIAEAQNMLQAISIMYGRGGADEEPFESRDERKRLMERFLSRALPAGGRYVGGTERAAGRDDGPRGASRLRGSLARGAGDRLAISAAVIRDEDGSDEPPRRRAGSAEEPEPGRRGPDTTPRAVPSRVVTPRSRRHDPDDDEA